MIKVRLIGWLVLLLGGFVATCSFAAAERISTGDFFASAAPVGIIDNAAFTPNPGAAPAHEPFLGTLHLTETSMVTEPDVFAPRSVLGRDPKLFPGAALAFFTDRGDLVPFTQEVIRVGSVQRGSSFWDIIVQPGRVWSESQDRGWSRAAFPFALMNSIEGETHNGIATFLYKGRQVSDVRFQIVQQTAPYYIKDEFVASGIVHASLADAATAELAALRRHREAERRDAVRFAPFTALPARVSRDHRADFDGTMRARDIVLSGLDYAGTFYLKSCGSAAGPLPWCDRARFGVWSATKALANETALLRLAEKYGPLVFELKIKDYVPEAAAHRAWSEVRFEDAIDMATGIGNGSLQRDPNDTNDGYLDASYPHWYEAGSVKDKLAAMLADGGTYPWGPGQVTRYRDQDMFILGVAMDRFLKSKEGAAADIWSMLRNEVFEPIGIHEAPTNRTIESDGSAGQPIMAFGYYPTIGDLVLIARLYQSEGRLGARQILYAPRIRELLPGPKPRGFPTGEKLPSGETTYWNAFWISSFAAPGCRVFYPRMLGWGGDIVALLPGGSNGIRLAKSGATPDNAEDNTDGMARVANDLSSICDPAERFRRNY